MEPKIRKTRAMVACQQIESMARRLLNDAHLPAANLERLGHEAMTDVLDFAVNTILEATKRVRLAAELEETTARVKAERDAANLSRPESA